MNNPISAAIATCTLALLSLSCVVADVTNDVRNTGAFLVKLTPDAVPKSLAADQWELSPLLSERVTRDESTGGRQWWYLAPRSVKLEAGASPQRPEQEVNPWDTAYALYEGSERALTARGITKEQIEFIEPDLAYRSQAEPQPSASPSACSSAGATAIAGSPQSKDWPLFQNVGDFQDLQYSQIKAARKAVEDKLRSIPLEKVRVAFLDTGYDPQHVACPKNVNAYLARNFVEYDKKKNPDGAPLTQQPGPQGSQHHGTGTIGIFGAGRITLCGPNTKIIFDDILGTAPMVEIIPMRVAKSVVHLLESSSSGTTRAIWYAWENNCDVISMSHGGLPSKALAEAINGAYDKGVAMFFASGDYLRKEPLPAQTPRYVVYPAAFSRTMCVCGVTADLMTYGLPPKGKRPILRGNWGPDAWMTNAIAAFSPNILWAHQPNVGSDQGENIIDLNGQGTSSSTPQAAGVAALWLQYHRDDKALTTEWRTWKKAEAVYEALRSTAKVFPDQQYSKTYFGNGILQANTALGKTPNLSVQKQKEATVGVGWIRLLASTLPVTGDPVLSEMLNLEISHVVQRSPKLQVIIAKYGGFIPEQTATTLPAGFRLEFLTELRKESRCSIRLTRWLLSVTK